MYLNLQYVTLNSCLVGMCMIHNSAKVVDRAELNPMCHMLTACIIETVSLHTASFICWIDLSLVLQHAHICEDSDKADRL